MSSIGTPTMPLTRRGDSWEYHVVHLNIDSFLFGPDINPDNLCQTLDTAGADGWELVNTVDVNRGHGRTSELVFIFKRPRSS